MSLALTSIALLFSPLIIGVALMIFLLLRSKNKQREMMIEKGINPEGISILTNRQLNSLTNGVLFIALSLGALLGYTIQHFFNPLQFVLLYFICITFTCGVGFVINFYIYKKTAETAHSRQNK
jgi:F0F1-type ATP synthase assembly protein I